MFDEEGARPHGLRAQPGAFFLSINRYERKKNLGLAVEAFSRLPAAERAGTRLVMAGGFDTRVEENVEHYKELDQLVESLELQDQVELLRSPSDAEKVWLLRNALCLVYTPTNEHFGIVPLESMYCRTPVIAANSGGPTETILNAETGWLREPSSEEFSGAMQGVLDNRPLLPQVGEAGRARVLKHFSFAAFGEKLERAVIDLLTKRRPGRSFLARLALAFHFGLALCVLYWMTFGVPVP